MNKLEHILPVIFWMLLLAVVIQIYFYRRLKKKLKESEWTNNKLESDYENIVSENERYKFNNEGLLSEKKSLKNNLKGAMNDNETLRKNLAELEASLQNPMKNHEKYVNSLTPEARFSLFRKIVAETKSSKWLRDYNNYLEKQIQRYVKTDNSQETEE